MLKGTLDDFTLADIFKLLSFSKKTGRVELVRKAGMGRVFFRDGDVYYAESSLSREPLGQKLIRARALTENHLRQALDENAESGERVGQILLREGWISEEQLELAVKQQIEDAVFDLLRWEIGDLEWEPNVTLEPEVPISVSVENLIMEASRRLDELETIARKVPSRHAIVAVTPAPPEGAVEINITPDEWRVLVLVDGHRNVETIANTIGLDEFQTMKIVHGMVSAGLIEVIGTDADQEFAPPPLPPLDTEVVQPPPPPPPHSHEAHEQVEEPEEHEEPFHPVGDEPFEASGIDAVQEAPPEAAEGAADEEAADEQAADEQASDEPPLDAEVQALYQADEPVPSAGDAEDPVGFPQGEGTLEETLFEANAEGEPAEETPAPPEEWFTDPELSMELFDAPSPGDLMTEAPTVNGTAAATNEVEAEASEGDGEAVPENELIDDHTPVEMPEPPPEPKAPPAPPISQVEGADRTAAVRELSDLFDDTPVERPKRPPLRRMEMPEDTQKRRVEDDEQVTKSLISRLIEGVKGL